MLLICHAIIYKIQIFRINMKILPARIPSGLKMQHLYLLTPKSSKNIKIALSFIFKWDKTSYRNQAIKAKKKRRSFAQKNKNKK